MCYISALLLLAAIFLVISVDTANDSIGCGNIFYRSDCLNNPLCTYCCSRPIGQQCVPRNESSACPLEHQPTNASQTCADLCVVNGGPEGDCKTCTSLNWCYFCYTLGSCVAPLTHCPQGVVLQTCVINEADSDSGSNGAQVWYHVVVYASSGVAGLLLMVALCIMAQRCRVRARLAQLLRPETRPLLSPQANGPQQTPVAQDAAPTPNAAANTSEVHSEIQVDNSEGNAQPNSDEPTNDEVASNDAGSSIGDTLCQLCYDSEAVIAFLPCYHVHCCQECSDRLRPHRTKLEINCPFCRQRVAAMVKLTSVVQKKIQ